MKTLYLHIGMPKTGTTYLQFFLHKNNPVLKEEGYVYPDFKVRFLNIGPRRNGHFLVSIIKDENGNRMYDREKEIEEECFEKLFACFEEYQNVILSEEQIWSSAEARRDKDFWDRLKKRLSAKDIALKIIVYLRRQDLFIQSSWAQEVKEKTLSMPIQEYILSKPFKRKKLNYYRRLNTISKYVGKENLLIRIYEKEQYTGPQKTIVSDFLNTIGLTYSDRYTELAGRYNRSFSGIYLEVKRELNKIEGFNRSKSYIQDLLKTLAKNNNDVRSISSNEFFTYEEMLDFYGKYRPSNRKVAAEYLGREDGRLFYEEIVENKEKREEYQISDYVEVFAGMLSLQNEKLEELREENRELKRMIKQMSASIPRRVVRKIRRMLNSTDTTGTQA